MMISAARTFVVECSPLLGRNLPRSLSTSVRLCEMWSKDFEEPLSGKEELKQLEGTTELSRKKIVPVKAAKNTATCSIFYDPVLERFKHTLMRRGNLEKVDRIMREAFAIVKEIQLKKRKALPEDQKSQVETNPIKILNSAIENAKPMLAIQPVPVGSVTYRVPCPITKHRMTFEAIRWIIDEVKDRDKKKERFHDKLARVLIETAEYTGRVIEKKHEHHRLCEMNRAYAHFRWTK